MWRELFSDAALLDLPVVAMFGFLAVFAFVVVRTMSRRRSEHFEQVARLPLDDGTSVPGSRGVATQRVRRVPARTATEADES